MKLTANSCFTRLYPEVIAKAIAALAVMHKPEKECNGGVLAILVQGQDGSTYEAHHIGKPGENASSVAFFAAEKIRRLVARRKTVDGGQEVASSQSANPDEEKFGGCVVAHIGDYEVFLSFSGAPAVVDEVVMQVVAEVLGFTVVAACEYTLLPQARALLKGCALCRY